MKHLARLSKNLGSELRAANERAGYERYTALPMRKRVEIIERTNEGLVVNVYTPSDFDEAIRLERLAEVEK